MTIFRHHGISATGDGGVHVAISQHERDALVSLVDALEQVAATDEDGLADPDGPLDDLRARLYPAAYDDPLDQLEYAEMMGTRLTEERQECLQVFRDSLVHQGKTSGSGWSVDLDPDQTSAWLGAVNDGRLVLAILCGVQDESDWEDIYRRQDPSAAMLGFLGMLQGQLVDALMGDLPDERP